MLLLLPWPGHVEVMAVAILWFIGCIKVVGVVLVVVVALVYQILVGIVFLKNLIYKKKHTCDSVVPAQLSLKAVGKARLFAASAF